MPTAYLNFIKCARWQAQLSIGIALIVLLGWLLKIELLKRIYPSFVAMNPTTAIAFILLGASVVWHSQRNHSVIASWASKLSGLSVAIIGATKIFSIITSIDLKIDQILFVSQLNETAINLPNRMAPNTAFNFLLLGSAIIFLSTKSRWLQKVCQILIFISACMSMLAIVGYFYNFVNLYGIPTYIPMALHTALNFINLAIAIAFVEPNTSFVSWFVDQGLIINKFKNFGVRTKLFTGFGILLVIFITFAFITHTNITTIQNNLIPLRAKIRNARIAALEMRRYEKDFLTRDVAGEYNNSFYTNNESENLKMWHKNYAYFIENLDALIAFHQQENNTAEVEKLTTLKSSINEYYANFLLIVAKYNMRGFKDYGLEGEMRRTIQDLETLTSSPAEAVFILQARRGEKDFFLRNDIQELERFKTATENLKVLYASQPAKMALLQRYIDTFHHIVRLKTEIGLRIDNGLTGKMRVAINQAEPVLEAEEVSILNLTNNRIDVIQKTVLALTGLFCLIGIGSAVATSQIILRSLRKVEYVAEQIAAGDLSQRIETTAKDEVGHLSQAFNDMVTKLQLAQNKLAAAKAQDEALLSSIGDGVFAVDTELRLILINKVAEKLINIKAQEALGKHYHDIFAFSYEDEPGKAYPDFVKQVITNGQVASLESRTLLKTSDGNFIPVADSASPITDAQGNIIGCIVVFRDVTQERELEQAKDDFLSVAAHQLRTPLGSMRWNIELVQNGDVGPISDTVKERLSQVYQSIHRMISLVNDLLDVSRIDQSRVQETPQPVELHSVITEMIADLNGLAEEKKITVAFNRENRPLPSLVIDQTHLRHVLQNLLSNAIKYNRPNGNVTITTYLQPDGIQVSIADTGIGIPDADQNEVFSKFYRGENALKSATEGSGLGLFVVKSYIEAWGGKIWFESKIDQGTTFYFTLPMHPNQHALGTHLASVQKTVQ
ncbi:MAG TPA: ATP-binding protein [Vitreimonas sp.]|nr:ATP-binding protein [Vitreimonas sp.]